MFLIPRAAHLYSYMLLLKSNSCNHVYLVFANAGTIDVVGDVSTATMPLLVILLASIPSGSGPARHSEDSQGKINRYHRNAVVGGKPATENISS